MSPFPRGRFMRRREAGEEAVAARGCKHAHPPRGGPSRARPGRQDSRSLGRSQVAASVRPSCHWQGPAAVGTNVTPPGIARSKPQTPCAERRATGGLAVNSDFSMPRCCEASGSVGPASFAKTRRGARRSARPRYWGAKRMQAWTRAPPRRPKNRGDDARLRFTFIDGEHALPPTQPSCPALCRASTSLTLREAWMTGTSPAATETPFAKQGFRSHRRVCACKLIVARRNFPATRETSRSQGGMVCR